MSQHNPNRRDSTAKQRANRKYGASPKGRATAARARKKYRANPAKREMEKARQREYARQRRADPAVRAAEVAYQKERLDKNPLARATQNIRSAVNKIIASKGDKTSARTADIIGYDPKILAAWAIRNGYKPPHTHIDHIVPIAWWLKRYPDDFRRAMKGAWNTANLRVISARQNRSKGGRRECLI